MAKRVYFCFHYQDVIDFRANVVRNHWVTKEHRDAAGSSVVTSKPASCGHFKTGQLNGMPGQDSYTSSADVFGNLFLKA
jgi:hypothetical protein